MPELPLYRVQADGCAFYVLGPDGEPIAGSSDRSIAERMAESYNRPPEEPASDPRRP